MNLTIEAVKALLPTGKRLSSPNALHTVVLVDGTPELIIKYGQSVWKTEAIAMQLVMDHTNVPVPRLVCYFSERLDKTSRCGYIVMEKAPGTPLASVIDSLDAEATASISVQLGYYLKELKTLDGRGWGMPGKNGMYHRTHFIYNLGPTRITSTKEFINYFAKAGCTPLPEDDSQNNELLRGIDLSRPPVFSHGDFLPENIMYDTESCKITSIIDWECAGHYPYFWNTYIARNRVGPRSKNWEKIYTSVMEECTLASRTFSIYFSSADFYGSMEFPEVRYNCNCCD